MYEIIYFIDNLITNDMINSFNLIKIRVKYVFGLSSFS